MDGRIWMTGISLKKCIVLKWMTELTPAYIYQHRKGASHG